ncbi:hypothetical protein DSM03_102284 [Leeuwenhoekiella aestuarii]|uniref:HPt domain-containing protein n=1 Tax=Leeuwenhoekiella aestuarii TaxID=2249426 RepID=A0A4Q0NUZ0_9FLAO|nr:Hpt domain-containing protein [Leeuwenhoekiella aestuarii]RXG15485.1 hypothetical protein DSM04_103374 [Leeuwenhoekiella aestuarii]RXG17408.1 hypothetical protein DSM03_102284 [Leeuwenhoekiella aestuarii]
MDNPNLNKIREIAGDQVEFQKEMITIIKEELPVEVEVYRKNLNAKYFLKSAEDVHKLKHKISILNMANSYELAINYENELRAGNPELAGQFEETLQNMLDFVAKL